MARSFGNATASSLIRSAEASLNKTNAYNDQMAAYEFELSAKTSEDFAKYKSYLDGRIKSVDGVDPSKALSLSRTSTSAYRTFNSAEISRATTAVKYGDISNRDKYSKMAQLYQAAVNNGDDNLAQSLESQLASLSVTIQNEDIAAQNKADANSKKALANATKQWNQAIQDKLDLKKELDSAKLSGQITPAQYDSQMRQLYLGSDDGQTPGIIALAQQAKQATGDENGSFQDKLNQYAADQQVQKYVNGNKASKGAAGNFFDQVIVKNADGTYGFKQRDENQIASTQLLKDSKGNPVMDANGHAVTSNEYVTPSRSFTEDKDGKLTSLTYATNIDPNTGKVAPGTGAGALRQVNKGELSTDPDGVQYFYTEDGRKKYVGKDPQTGRVIMGYDKKLFKPDNLDSGTFGAPGGIAIGNPLSKEYWTSIANSIGLKTGGPKRSTGQIVSRGLGSIGNALTGLFQKADKQAFNEAEYKRQAAIEQAKVRAQQERQARLLPVFRPAPPPAPPKPVAKAPQYALPPLPAPVKLPGTNVTVPAKTGNYQKDVLNLGRSLGGLL